MRVRRSRREELRGLGVPLTPQTDPPHIHHYPAKDKQGLFWRYQTSGPGNYLMMRVQHNPVGQPKWVFVARWCFPDGTLPGQHTTVN